MICEVDGRDTIILQLFHVCIPFPENSIAPCRHSLLLACVIILGSHIEFVRGHELYWPLLKLRKEHIVKLALGAFVYREIMLIECQDQIILIQGLSHIAVGDLVQYFLSGHAIDPEV